MGTIVVGTIIDEARATLIDVSGTPRWSRTAEMLAFANDGVAKTRVMRPDLNWGSYNTAYVDLAAGAPFPFGLEYRPGIANYVVMRCEVADDPFAIEQRAIQLRLRSLRGPVEGLIRGRRDVRLRLALLLLGLQHLFVGPQVFF